MHHPHAIKVLLRRADGFYLAGQPGAWSISPDRTQAAIFDFVGEQIPEQLERLTEEQGCAWEAVPVDPRERYETCDGCGQRVMAFKILFDGSQYLCATCRKAPV